MNHQPPISFVSRTLMCSSTTDWDSSHGSIRPSLPSVRMHRPPSKSTPCQVAKTPSITKACLLRTCVKHSLKAHTKTSNSLMKKSTLMTLKFMLNTPHLTWNSMKKTTMTTAKKIMMKTVTTIMTTMTKTATTIMTIMMVDTKVMLTLRLRKPSLIQRAAQLTR